MSNPERVRDFYVENEGIQFCDDCVAAKLGINRHQVNSIAATLALSTEFQRYPGTCSQRCNQRDKLVTLFNDKKLAAA
jgi:hypothetical protein